MGLRSDVIGGIGLMIERSGATLANFFEQYRGDPDRTRILADGEAISPAGIEDIGRSIERLGDKIIAFALKD